MADDQNLDQNLEVEAVEAEAPSWVPEKFRSNPEEFGKAYGNLEREFHETRRQLKAHQEQIEAFISNQQQAAAQQPVEQNTDQLYAAYESDPVATTRWLAEQAAVAAVQGYQQQSNQAQQPLLRQQQEMFAVQVDALVSQRIGDWEDQKQNVVDYIEQRPYLFTEAAAASPLTAADALQAAYKVMRFDEIQNQGQTQAEALRAENERLKRQAQTLSGSPGSPAQTDADTDYWKSVVNTPSNKFSLS